jgi:hypothetical protein
VLAAHFVFKETSLGRVAGASLVLAVANLSVFAVHVTKCGYLRRLFRRRLPRAERALQLVTIADGVWTGAWIAGIRWAFAVNSIAGVVAVTVLAPIGVLFLAAAAHHLLPATGRQRGTEVIKLHKLYTALVWALKKMAPSSGGPLAAERLEEQGGAPSHLSTFKSLLILLAFCLASSTSVAAAEGKITPRKGQQSQTKWQPGPDVRQPWDGDLPHGDYATRCQHQQPGRLPDGTISKSLHDLWLAPGRGLGAGQGGCSNPAVAIPNIPGGYVSFGRCAADLLTAGITVPELDGTKPYAVMVQGTQGVAFTTRALLDATLLAATSKVDIGPGQMFAITTTAGSYLFVRPLTNGGDVPPAQRIPHGACDPVSTLQYPYSILPPAAARLLLEYVSTHQWVWPIDDATPGSAPGQSFTLHLGAVSGPAVGHLWCLDSTCTVDAGAWQKTTSASLLATEGQLAAVASSVR